MSAESGNPALRFDWTGDGMQYHQYGQYVGHEDYAKLEQQRAALVEALTKCKRNRRRCHRRPGKGGAK